MAHMLYINDRARQGSNKYRIYFGAQNRLCQHMPSFIDFSMWIKKNKTGDGSPETYSLSSLIKVLWIHSSANAIDLKHIYVSIVWNATRI